MYNTAETAKKSWCCTTSCFGKIESDGTPPYRHSATAQSHHLEQLSTFPTYVKSHERTSINKFKFNFVTDIKPEGMKRAPLSRLLDPNVKYLWVLLKREDCADAQLAIGYEHKDSSHKYGHPTLFDNPSERRGLIGGELINRNGEWMLDNNSGRFGSGNRRARRFTGICVQDLLQLAKQHFDRYTDLKIKTGIEYSDRAWKRGIQFLFKHGRPFAFN